MLRCSRRNHAMLTESSHGLSATAEFLFLIDAEHVMYCLTARNICFLECWIIDKLDVDCLWMAQGLYQPTITTESVPTDCVLGFSPHYRSLTEPHATEQSSIQSDTCWCCHKSIHFAVMVYLAMISPKWPQKWHFCACCIASLLRPISFYSMLLGVLV